VPCVFNIGWTFEKKIGESPLYQSSGKRYNFKGFRTCLVAVFGFAVAFFLAQIRTQSFGRIPSTIIFKSNRERFCRERAHTFRLCISRVGSEISSKVFVRIRLHCLGSIIVSSWRKLGHKVLAVYLLPSSSNRITNALAVEDCLVHQLRPC